MERLFAFLLDGVTFSRVDWGGVCIFNRVPDRVTLMGLQIVET